MIMITCCRALETPADVQVGMSGSVPEEVRQNILAPLQDLPHILEVCCW